jgi:hypothetical protein
MHICRSALECQRLCSAARRSCTVRPRRRWRACTWGSCRRGTRTLTHADALSSSPLPMRRSVARRPFSRRGILGGRYLLASSRRSAWSVQHVTPRWLSGVSPLVSGSCRWAGGMEGPLEDEHDLALQALPEAGDHESLRKPPSIRGVRIEAASSSVGSNALKDNRVSAATDASRSTGPRSSQLRDVATYCPDDAGG